MRYGLLAAICLLIVLVSRLIMSPACAEDWYRFRGPELNGVSSETNWSHAWGSNGPRELWRTNVGTGLSNIVVSAGRAYALGNADNVETVTCLDTATGESKWRHSYAAPIDPNEFEGGPTSTPTIDGDRLYTLSRQGDLFCFNSESGELHWQLQVAELATVRIPTWGFAGSPLVVGELLLCNVGEAGAAVNKQTGELVWSSADRDAGYSSMVSLRVDDQSVVVFGSSRSYVCVNALSGAELWRERWLTTFGCNAADPIVHGQQIFISSGYNRGCMLLNLKSDGVEEVWKNKEMQNQISSSVLIDGFLYGIHGDVGAGAQLRCMELLSGEVKWTEESFRAGAISAAGARLLVLTDDGELLVIAAKPDACTMLAKHRVLNGKCWTSPVLSGGQVYCRTAQGELVSLRVD